MKNNKNKAKFTPGPWGPLEPKDGINIEGHAVTADLHTGRYIIAEMRGPISFEQDKANAHLIAAAPEMFEVLERLVGVLQSEYASSELTEATKWNMDEALIALAKAKGES